MEGRDKIIDLIKQYDLRKKSLGKNDIRDFIQAVLEGLNDKTQRDQGVTVEAQLREGKTRADLYEFFFQMSYLDVQYKVTFNGKDLNEDKFSPGEKGALLLIFYLLIDKGGCTRIETGTSFPLLVQYQKEESEWKVMDPRPEGFAIFGALFREGESGEIYKKLSVPGITPVQLWRNKVIPPWENIQGPASGVI